MSKIGAEILVNTQKLYDQTLAQTAKLKSGGFVTVWVDWADSNQTGVADSSWSGIKAQVFSSLGAKVGTEILVNTATLNWQQDPQVVVLQNGDFVVTWTDGWDYFGYADHPGSEGIGGATGDKLGKAIKAQVFSAGGSPIGGEILVNTETRSGQTGEKITALANGNFVVAWEDWSMSCTYAADGSLSACGGGPGIKAQVFDSGGAKIGTEIAVTEPYNYAPQITALVDGGFVLAWHDGHYSVDDVRAQVFSQTAAPVGAQILVNTNGAGATWSMQSEEKVVALADGGFAVAWTDNNGDGSSKGIKAQVFAATGAPVGAEMLVNTTTLNQQWHPQLAALKNGGFVVVWENWGGANTAVGIQVNAQLFASSGAKLGTEILVNTTPAGSINGAGVAALGDGNFVVSWSDFSEVSYQLFDPSGQKIVLQTLANTTTAGGQTAAQATALDNAGFVVAWNDNLYGPSDGSGTAVKAQVFNQAAAGFGATPADDRLLSTSGDDQMDGLGGIDAVIFTGKLANSALTKTAAGWQVRSAAEGTDQLTNIERLQFSDQKLALDLGAAEHAGQALEFIGLMAPHLVHTPAVLGLILDFFDKGMDLKAVCQLALDVDLVKSIAGANTNAALAAMAFRNVIGVEPDAAVVDLLMGYMDGRSASYSQAQFMAVVAGLELNQIHIDLVGLQQTGIAYISPGL